jgi:serine/threonine-protein kinase
MVDVAGASLGKYTLLAKLAVGGMAEIFAAKRPGGGFVVVKRILPQFADNPQFVQMFLDEARVASRIRHPNVCEVFELGRLGRQYFIAMELLEGVTLARLISRVAKSGRRIEIPIALGIITQACEGLNFAHDLKGFDGRPANLVHRDVSPQNLFITSDGVVKVLDFGIAKTQSSQATTRTGTLKGKSGYMSPEQVRGGALDRRSDVFSLAVVCYETLTCRRLFTRDNEFQTYDAILNATIPDITTTRSDVPPTVSRAVLGGLVRSQADRHPSCKVFAESLVTAARTTGGIAQRAIIRSAIERIFGPEIEAQRKQLHDALSDLPTEQIQIQKRKPGEISELSGLLLDDLGDVGMTLLDDLAPIDLGLPPAGDRAATTPLRGEQLPKTSARTPSIPIVVSTVATDRSEPVATASDEPDQTTATTDRGTWLGVAIVVVVVAAVLGVAVFLIITARERAELVEEVHPLATPVDASVTTPPRAVDARAGSDAAVAAPRDAAAATAPRDAAAAAPRDGAALDATAPPKDARTVDASSRRGKSRSNK